VDPHGAVEDERENDPSDPERRVIEGFAGEPYGPLRAALLRDEGLDLRVTPTWSRMRSTTAKCSASPWPSGRSWSKSFRTFVDEDRAFRAWRHRRDAGRRDSEWHV